MRSILKLLPTFLFTPAGMDMNWNCKSMVDMIDPDGYIQACHWVNDQHLAVCMLCCVKVYEVTMYATSRLIYTLTSQEWKGRYVMDVAVSDALPGSMLVICKRKSYVYQHPCYESTQELNKYLIQSDSKASLWCIVANDRIAILGMGSQIEVYNLPEFTYGYTVQTTLNPWDLSISADYLLIMGKKEMIVKSLCGMGRDVYSIQLPDTGLLFTSVSLQKNGREIFVACRRCSNPGSTYSISRYTWDGKGEHGSQGSCIVDGLSWVSYRCSSMASNGLLAIGQGHEEGNSYNKKLYLYKPYDYSL